MSQSPANKRSAFTLIELLVVVGIIVLLIAVLIPVVMRSMRSGARMRAQADFQTIGFALDAYKQDFGDYPRLPVQTSGASAGQPMENTGAATLGKALLGPYGDGLTPTGSLDTLDPPTWQSSVAYNPGDCVGDGSGKNYYVTLITNTGQTVSNADYYAPFNPLDGADGPGFRTRTPAAGTLPQGKVWGPYLAPGKVKNQGVFLLDSYGGPILYFPARPATPNLSPSPAPATAANGGSPYVDLPASGSAAVLCLYNAYDNLQAFRRQGVSSEDPPGGSADLIVLNRIRIMFGDYNNNGAIDPTANPSETAVTLPFVLMSAGSDGQFGPTSLFSTSTGKDDFSNTAANQKAVQNCDDVTNFQ
jgi:type II secretory pathway pseudopilin PulG